MSEAAPETPTPALPTPPKDSSPPTEYLILTAPTVGTKDWREQTTISARGAQAAIRSFLEGVTEPEGVYVAVPARSWKPVQVKTEQQTKLKFT